MSFLFKFNHRGNQPLDHRCSDCDIISDITVNVTSNRGLRVFYWGEFPSKVHSGLFYLCCKYILIITKNFKMIFSVIRISLSTFPETENETMNPPFTIVSLFVDFSLVFNSILKSRISCWLWIVPQLVSAYWIMTGWIMAMAALESIMEVDEYPMLLLFFYYCVTVKYWTCNIGMVASKTF